MKLNSISKYVVGAAALSGLAFSGAATAVTFNANATVQNTLTVTNVADMELGTIFATSASSSVYKYMVLGTNGDFGTPQGDSSITLISLDGESAAQASVTIGTDTAFTLTLPDAELGSTVQLVTAGDDTNSEIAAMAALGDQVLIDDTANNPAVAHFQLVNFTVGEVPVAEGTAAGACGTVNDNVNTCVITPAFGASAITFAIGATLVTDTTGTTTYQATTYTGTFDVTASY